MLSLIPKFSLWPFSRAPSLVANSQNVWTQLTFRDGTPLEEVSDTPLLLGTGATIASNRLVNTDITVAALANIQPAYIQPNEDFSIEGWFNFTSVVDYLGSILTLDMLGGGGEGNRSFMFSVTNNLALYCIVTPSGSTENYGKITANNIVSLNKDTHIAVSRVGGIMKLYLNGAAQLTVANAVGGFKSTEFMSVRRGATGSRWNIRMMRGKSAYSADFIPPTTLPVIVNESYDSTVQPDVLLQCCMRRNALVNEATGEAITLSGTAAVAYGRLTTTAVNSSRFSVPCKYFGAADFTVECKARLPVNPATAESCIMGQYGNAFDQYCNWLMWTSSARAVVFYWVEADGTTRSLNPPNALPLNVDTHIVVEKVGGTITMYFDGVVVATAASTKAMIDRSSLRPVRSAWDNTSSTANTLSVTNIRIAKRAMYNGVINPSVTLPKFRKTIDKLLTVNAARGSLINFNEYKSVDDNRAFLPNTSVQAIDRTLNVSGAPGLAATYPAPYPASDKLVGIQSVSAFGFVSKDGGKTAFKSVGSGASYSYGALMFFKQNLYECTGGSWGRHTNTFDLDGTMTTVAVTSDPANAAYWANNANAIIGSTSTSANAANAYVAWTFGTFTAFNVGNNTNTQWHYIGNNIFHVSTPSNGISKLVFVGATQANGVATVQTLDLVKAARVAHIGDYLFFIGTDNILRATPLKSVPENHLTSSTDARTYAQAIFAATTSASAVVIETIGTWKYMTRWGDDRIIIGKGTGNANFDTVVYGVQNYKPTIPFTIKAVRNTNSTTAQSQTGYTMPGVSGVTYGLTANTVGPITQPAGETIVLCSDFYRKVGANTYNGLSIGIAGADGLALIAKYRGIQVNGKIFLFQSAVVPTGTVFDTSAFEAKYNVPTFVQWSWGITLADLADGVSYTVELLQR